MDSLKVPTVQNFVWCLSLRNGVKVFGWIFLTGHIFTGMEYPFYNLWFYIHCDSMNIYTDLDTGSHICPDWLNHELLLKFVMDFSLSVAQIGTSFLLLLGVYQQISRYIIQWVIIQIVLLIIDIIMTEAGFLRAYVTWSGITSILYYIWKSVEAYGILICYSYYKTLETSPPAQVVQGWII